MRKKIDWKLKWLFWLQAWAALLDGICGVVTFGLIRPGLLIRVAEKTLRYQVEKAQHNRRVARMVNQKCRDMAAEKAWQHYVREGKWPSHKETME